MNGSLSTWNAAIASSSAAIADLQAFFPFDPYRLPQSSRWFEGMYRDWTMVAVGDDDDEEEEEDESDEEDKISGSIAIQVGGMREMTADSETETTEDEEDEELYGVPMELGSVREERRVRAQLGVSESFGKMSISPAQDALHQHVGEK
jgi:RNA polymerase I-specific transcription initiation factor RRN3